LDKLSLSNPRSFPSLALPRAGSSGRPIHIGPLSLKHRLPQDLSFSPSLYHRQKLPRNELKNTDEEAKDIQFFTWNIKRGFILTELNN
jgi:hypothetical protein